MYVGKSPALDLSCYKLLPAYKQKLWVSAVAPTSPKVNQILSKIFTLSSKMFKYTSYEPFPCLKRPFLCHKESNEFDMELVRRPLLKELCYGARPSAYPLVCLLRNSVFGSPSIMFVIMLGLRVCLRIILLMSSASMPSTFVTELIIRPRLHKYVVYGYGHPWRLLDRRRRSAPW